MCPGQLPPCGWQLAAAMEMGCHSFPYILRRVYIGDNTVSSPRLNITKDHSQYKEGFPRRGGKSPRWLVATHIKSFSSSSIPFRVFFVGSLCVVLSMSMSMSMSMSRRAKVAVGVLGTLAALNGVHAGWTWLDNTRLVNQVTRESASYGRMASWLA